MVLATIMVYASYLMSLAYFLNNDIAMYTVVALSKFTLGACTSLIRISFLALLAFYSPDTRLKVNVISLFFIQGASSILSLLI